MEIQCLCPLSKPCLSPLHTSFPSLVLAMGKHWLGELRGADALLYSTTVAQNVCLFSQTNYPYFLSYVELQRALINNERMQDLELLNVLYLAQNYVRYSYIFLNNETSTRKEKPLFHWKFVRTQRNNCSYFFSVNLVLP